MHSKPHSFVKMGIFCMYSLLSGLMLTRTLKLIIFSRFLTSALVDAGMLQMLAFKNGLIFLLYL